MNFFIEGIQGSRKSTLVRKLSEKYTDYRAICEGDYSPVELAMWDKIFLMYDYFEDLSIYVSDKLGFPLDLEESRNVRTFMQKRYEGDMELGDGVKGP